MKEKLFEVLKTMRTGNRNLEDIASTFPFTLANTLKLYMTKTMSGMEYPIRYDYNRLMEFRINMGAMIHNQDFKNIYSVTLQFLKSFNYFYAMYVFYVKFPEPAITEFREKCESIKNKEWDDMISEFIDSVLKLFKQGRFGNSMIE